jgi:hypothetical protein
MGGVERGRALTDRLHRDMTPSRCFSRRGVEFSHDYARWNLAGEGDTGAFFHIGMTWSTLTLAMSCKKEHIGLPYTASICPGGNLHTLISMQHK